MRSHKIRTIGPNISIPHENCEGQAMYGMQGGFDLLLDSYHQDDLEKNGYTVAEDYCLLCAEQNAFFIKLLPQG